MSGHDVFISYSAKDKAIADAVCFALESRKIRCWIAPRDVTAGIPYAEALLEALDGCRVMVLLLSSNSNTSPQVMREVERAASKGAYIVPVRIEDIALSPSLQFFIGPIHWIDALTPPLEKHLDYLAETVGYVLGRVTKGRPPVPEKGILPEPGAAVQGTPPGLGTTPPPSPILAPDVTQTVSGTVAPPAGVEAPSRIGAPPRIEVPPRVEPPPRVEALPRAEVPPATQGPPMSQKPRARLSVPLIAVGAVLGVALLTSAGTGAYFVIKSLREGQQASAPNRPPGQTPPAKPPGEAPVLPSQPAPKPPVAPPPAPPQPGTNPPAVPPAQPPAAPPAGPAKPLPKPPAAPTQPAPKPAAPALPVPTQMKIASTSGRVAAGGTVTFDFTFVLDAKQPVPAEDTVAWRSPDSQLHYGTYGQFTAVPGLNTRHPTFTVGTSRPPGTEFPVFGVVRIGGKLYKTQVPFVVRVGGLVDQVRLTPTSPTLVPAGGKVNFDLTFVLEANQSMPAEWNYALRSPNGTLSYMNYLSFTASPGTNTVHTTLTVGASQSPGSVLSLLGVVRINGTLYQGRTPVFVRVTGGSTFAGGPQVDQMRIVPTSSTQVPAGQKVFFDLTFVLTASGPVTAEDTVAVSFPDGRVTYLSWVHFSASPGLNTRSVWYSPGQVPPGTTLHIDWLIRVNGRVYQTQQGIPITVLPR